jgi:hypothetical protein
VFLDDDGMMDPHAPMHWTAVVDCGDAGRWHVDWTARQFDLRAPAPKIERDDGACPMGDGWQTNDEFDLDQARMEDVHEVAGASLPEPNPRVASDDDIDDYEDSEAYWHTTEVGFDADETVVYDPDDLKGLWSNQPDLTSSRVRDLVHDPSDEPIMVLDVSGRRWIFDGNHRVEAAIRAGRTLKAHMMFHDW